MSRGGRPYSRCKVTPPGRGVGRPIQRGSRAVSFLDSKASKHSPTPQREGTPTAPQSPPCLGLRIEFFGFVFTFEVDSKIKAITLFKRYMEY